MTTALPTRDRLVRAIVPAHNDRRGLWGPRLAGGTPGMPPGPGRADPRFGASAEVDAAKQLLERLEVLFRVRGSRDDSRPGEEGRTLDVDHRDVEQRPCLESEAAVWHRIAGPAAQRAVEPGVGAGRHESGRMAVDLEAGRGRDVGAVLVEAEQVGDIVLVVLRERSQVLRAGRGRRRRRETRSGLPGRCPGPRRSRSGSAPRPRTARAAARTAVGR